MFIEHRFKSLLIGRSTRFHHCDIIINHINRIIDENDRFACIILTQNPQKSHIIFPSILTDNCTKKADTKRTRPVEQKMGFMRSHSENPTNNKEWRVRVQDEELSRVSTNYITKETGWFFNMDESLWFTKTNITTIIIMLDIPKISVDRTVQLAAIKAHFVGVLLFVATL